MWPRTLTGAMGMDEESFIKAFVKALQNEAVISSMKLMFNAELRNEIGELKELVQEKERKIEELEKKVCDLELNCDALER